MILKNSWLYFLVFELISCHLYSQRDISHEQLLEYVNKYSGENAVILNSEIDINIRLDKGSNKPVVKKSINNDILYLQSVTDLSLIYFYDNKSELIDNYYSSNKICGNYEVDGIFHSDAKFCNYYLPYKEPGATYDFKITKVFHDIKYYTTEFFNDAIPVEKKIIHFNIPVNFDVNIWQFNMDGVKYKVDTSYSKDKKNKIITFELSHLDAFEHDANSTSVNVNYPHLIICIKSYTDKNSRQINLIRNTGDLYSWYKSLISQTKNDTLVLSSLIDQIIENKETDLEKIKAIYKWVQDNIRYLAYEYESAGYIPESVQNVIDKRYGDCKGVSNLLKELLRLCGFDARLCWIGTNSLIYDHSLPSVAVDNHMICAVNIQGKRYYLDATAKYLNLGEYPEYIQGREVLIEDGENFIIDHIPEHLSSYNKTTYTSNLFYSDGLLNGDINVKIEGIERAKFLILKETVGNKTEVFLKKYLFNDSNDILWEYSDSEFIQNDTMVFFSFPVRIKSNCIETGSTLIIFHSLFDGIETRLIDTTRFTDYDIGERRSIIDKVIFNIPSDYSLKKLPEKCSYVSELFKIEYTYKLIGNQIELKRELDINKGIIPKENFNQWNEMAKIAKKQNTKGIILQKRIP